MATAYTQVTNDGYTSNLPVSIRCTHYYVKFKPEDMDQYEELVSDSTLGFQDYPIEATVIQNGNRYHDPSLPDSVPTYQYTAVPADYTFSSSIPYDILDSLYIPEVDTDLTGKDDNNQPYIDKLLDQAYIQTGNYEDTVKDYSQRTAAKYTPGGRIQIRDTRLNAPIGMEGVQVTARRWFIPLRAKTDFNGNYRMKLRFNRRANYSVWFFSDHFTVKENLFGLRCFINGPKQTGDWNYMINDGYDRFVGHIFRGAYRYNHKNIGGLARPWRPIGLQQYLAKNSFKGGQGITQGINWIVLPIIKIWRYQNAEQVTEFESDEIFSTTCHETGHTSHVLRMRNAVLDYTHVTNQIQESWPTAIEWFITHIEYAERGIANYGESNYHPNSNTLLQAPNDYGYQYWSPNSDGGRYTSLFIDIIDNHNQIGNLYFQRTNGFVDDAVQDFPLPFIEQHLLKHIFDLNTLSGQLKSNKPPGVTDAQIDLLISHF